MNHFPRSFARVVAPIFLLALFGQGCLGGTSKSTSTAPDGGVWKTTDRGVTWANKRAFVQGPKVSASAATFSVVQMAFDPQDTNTVYMGTGANGLVYSLDGGDSWTQAKTLSTGRINAVAVDPKNKCTVYASSGNKIYKTDTCGRDWTQIFFDPRTDKSFTQLVVDWYNSTNLYAGTSDGDVFKSRDGGRTWQTVKRVDGAAITSLVMDPRDSRLLFVGTLGDGIWKTPDGGSTWVQIKKQFGDEYRDARRVTQIVLDPKVANVMYVVSKYGIIKSENQGETWKALNLTAPPETIKIASLAIDPTDNKKMVYTGVNTIAYTADAGVTWSAKKLPTTRAGSALLIEPKNGSIIYLGTVPQAKN